MAITARTPFLDVPAAELAARYTFTVSWSWDEQAYVASVPEWPSLVGQGPTVKDALKDVRWFVQAAIEECRATGTAFPHPAAMPAGVGAVPNARQDDARA